MNNKYSKQRNVVLEVIKNTCTHPTAEEVYNMVQKVDSKISKSTVYRNINILVENELIKRITMSVGTDRFDYIHKPHHHITCDMCGSVYDFFYDFKKQEIIDEVKKQTKVETDLECITINGICENCKSKLKIKEEI